MLSIATSFPTQLYVSKIWPCNCVWLEFTHFTAVSYSFFVSTTFCLLTPPFFFIDEHVGYFQFGAVANSAAARYPFIASQLQIHASLPCFVMLDLDPVNILLLLLDLSIEGSGETW